MLRTRHLGRICLAGALHTKRAIDGKVFPLSVSSGDGSRHDVALTEQALDEAFIEYLSQLLIGNKAFDSAKREFECKARSIELRLPSGATQTFADKMAGYSDATSGAGS